MPRYLIVRKFDVQEDEMPEVGRRSRRTIEESYPEITWEHSHVIVDGEKRAPKKPATAKKEEDK